jgi:hypothetical protein
MAIGVALLPGAMPSGMSAIGSAIVCKHYLFPSHRNPRSSCNAHCSPERLICCICPHAGLPVWALVNNRLTQE